MNNLKNNIESFLSVGNKVLENIGCEAGMFFNTCIKHGIIPLLHNNKMGTTYMTLPYKVKTKDESMHLIKENLKQGEKEKLNSIFQSLSQSYYVGFYINEIIRRKSTGDGINFEYELTLKFNQNKKDELHNNIMDHIKKLDIDKSDIEKKIRRTKYITPSILKLWNLISIANTTLR